MKVFICDGYVPSRCSCCAGDEYLEIVVANHESEALGFVLERFSETLAKHWDIFEVDSEKFGIVDGWK